MTTYSYSDKYLDAYTSLYGQLSPATQAVFPAVPLALLVELLLNGTWTNITSYAYQRDGSVNIAVSSGRPDESSKLVTATCAMELNNRDGTFSARNAAGPFYPFLTRNTQLRVSCQADYNGTDAGTVYLFWGEVSAWPPSWDVTGSDVWVDITASGITRRLNQQAAIGSALKRYYLKKDTSDPTYPVAYWPCEDGSSSTQLAEVTGAGTAATVTGSPTLASDTSFTGSDAIPVINGGYWTGATGSYVTTGDDVYATPGTYAWPRPAGVTTVHAKVVAAGGGGGGSSDSTSTWEAGGGGAGEYAEDSSVTVSADTHTVVVGAGGIAGGVGGFTAADGGNSSFAGDSVTVLAHGGVAGHSTSAGSGGTGSSASVHKAGGAGYYDGTIGGGGGGAGDSSAVGTSASGATGGAPSTYGGPGGDGGGAAVKNYVKSYTATASYTFEGSDGHQPNTKIQTNRLMTQGGDYSDTYNGKCKTFIMFDYSQIASDLSGATITKCTLRLRNDHSWYNSGMTVSLGWDTGSHSGSSNTDPTLHNSLEEYSIGEGATLTQDIGTQFGTAFKSSSATCLKLFKNSNSLTYYGYFDGPSQSTPPVFTVYYSK